MKVGVRVPNISKRIKARTTGKLKRKMKKAMNPFYGKKGMGLITNPKKSVYNKVYRKTTISPFSNEILIHVCLFIFTAGIGNIIYILVKKK